ncbi:adenosylcobinamide-GDP ribazoletransferase [Rhodococcus sovatensis]|uniref:Adenosylcobinamide-GDP ribazoletransferase n=1 Tax=Rhodococcus sovatensis TaxID=1805840 RepID=A0ABZ2PRE7_9NOCA
MRAALVGPRLALSWLTVLPVRGPHSIGRDESRQAIAWTPAVGALLGSVSAILLWLFDFASLPSLVAGLVTVACLALLTRGMHVDGLADTADGLGCYGPPERAREVMQSGSAGPFGVATVALVLAIQAAGLGQLAHESAWVSVLLAIVVGRVAVVLACRRGIPPATTTGFGALVADSQSRVVVAAWTLVTLAVSVLAVQERWWQGPVVTVVALSAAALGIRHCVRRFGGVNGDVLGATVEVTTTITVVGLLLGG